VYCTVHPVSQFVSIANFSVMIFGQWWFECPLSWVKLKNHSPLVCKLVLSLWLEHKLCEGNYLVHMMSLLCMDANVWASGLTLTSMPILRNGIHWHPYPRLAECGWGWTCTSCADQLDLWNQCTSINYILGNWIQSLTVENNPCWATLLTYPKEFPNQAQDWLSITARTAVFGWSNEKKAGSSWETEWQTTNWKDWGNWLWLVAWHLEVIKPHSDSVLGKPFHQVTSPMKGTCVFYIKNSGAQSALSLYQCWDCAIFSWDVT